MSAVAKPEDPSPILACTVSRDVQDFELLIDEMEAQFGEAWGDLMLHEALAFWISRTLRSSRFWPWH